MFELRDSMSHRVTTMSHAEIWDIALIPHTTLTGENLSCEYYLNINVNQNLQVNFNEYIFLRL